MAKKGGVSHDRKRTEYMRQWFKDHPEARDPRHAMKEVRELLIAWRLERPQPPERPNNWEFTDVHEHSIHSAKYKKRMKKKMKRYQHKTSKQSHKHEHRDRRNDEH